MMAVIVRGLIETKRNLETAADELHGAPITRAMHQAVLLVEGDAKRNAPVDTGRLRASIASEVRVEGLTAPSVTGVVGSNVSYAAAVELGSRPHFPPVGVLDTWARRHGMDAYLVARAIARRGTPARHYLKNAFDSNTLRIIRILGDGVSGVVQKANQP